MKRNLLDEEYRPEAGEQSRPDITSLGTGISLNTIATTSPYERYLPPQKPTPTVPIPALPESPTCPGLIVIEKKNKKGSASVRKSRRSTRFNDMKHGPTTMTPERAKLVGNARYSRVYGNFVLVGSKKEIQSKAGSRIEYNVESPLMPVPPIPASYLPGSKRKSSATHLGVSQEDNRDSRVSLHSTVNGPLQPYYNADAQKVSPYLPPLPSPLRTTTFPDDLQFSPTIEQGPAIVKRAFSVKAKKIRVRMPSQKSISRNSSKSSTYSRISLYSSNGCRTPISARTLSTLGNRREFFDSPLIPVIVTPRSPLSPRSPIRSPGLMYFNNRKVKGFQGRRMQSQSLSIELPDDILAKRVKKENARLHAVQEQFESLEGIIPIMPPSDILPPVKVAKAPTYTHGRSLSTSVVDNRTASAKSPMQMQRKVSRKPVPVSKPQLSARSVVKSPRSPKIINLGNPVPELASNYTSPRRKLASPRRTITTPSKSGDRRRSSARHMNITPIGLNFKSPIVTPSFNQDYLQIAAATAKATTPVNIITIH